MLRFSGLCYAIIHIKHGLYTTSAMADQNLIRSWIRNIAVVSSIPAFGKTFLSTFIKTVGLV